MEGHKSDFKSLSPSVDSLGAARSQGIWRERERGGQGGRPRAWRERENENGQPGGDGRLEGGREGGMKGSEVLGEHGEGV